MRPGLKRESVSCMERSDSSKMCVCVRACVSEREGGEWRPVGCDAFIFFVPDYFSTK